MRFYYAPSARRLPANTEIDILVELRTADPIGQRHIVRLETHFEHRGHPVLVFPCLSSNLYELLKYTKFRGVSLDLIHKFAKQILEALAFLGERSIIHCDLKPENLLLTQPKRSSIKVIDFGSSCKSDKKMYSYIQSRFYRAPEIIIGVPYTADIDIWSLGCILCEMHTGEPLFGGADSHDQLFKITRVLGDVPSHLIARAEKADKYFDGLCLKCPSQYATADKGGFLDIPPKRPLAEILASVHERRLGERGHTREHYEAFLGFIEGMLRIAPEARVKPSAALQHPFVHSDELWPRKTRTATSSGSSRDAPDRPETATASGAAAAPGPL